MNSDRCARFVLLLMIAAFWFGCGSKSTDTDPGSEADKKEGTVPEIVESPAVCIQDGMAMRVKPDQQSKWMSSISLGEKVTWLGLTRTDSVKNWDYYKVRLVDNKEGWALASAIVTGAKPAAVVEKMYIYKRPDLSTITTNTLEPLDLIAVLEETEQAGWIEVIRSGDWSRRTVWVKNEGFSENDKDIAVASLTTKALAEKDFKKKKEKIQEILSNPALAGSVLLSDLEYKFFDLEEAEKKQN